MAQKHSSLKWQVKPFTEDQKSRGSHWARIMVSAGQWDHQLVTRVPTDMMPLLVDPVSQGTVD